MHFAISVTNVFCGLVGKCILPVLMRKYVLIVLDGKCVFFNFQEKICFHDFGRKYIFMVLARKYNGFWFCLKKYVFTVLIATKKYVFSVLGKTYILDNKSILVKNSFLYFF